MKNIFFILIFCTVVAHPVYAFCYCVNVDFFSRFKDRYLDYYILQAIQNNHDIKQADYKVRQFRYEINNAFSKELPSLNVSGNYLGTHFPQNDYNFFIKNNSFILPFRTSWEPDLLLKNKDIINSVKFLYKAQLANQKSTYISLLTDVASAYVNILLYDFLIDVQKKILKDKDQNLSFSFNKFKLGVIDLINLNNSTEELNAQKIIFNNLVKNRNTMLYNLALLTGESPNNIAEFKRGKFDEFEYSETIPTIINSDLIYSRPDIIEAENKLKSAKIDVTVAKKEFFPSFNIQGSLVFDTAGKGNFFSWGSSFAYLLLGATQDIFKGGAKYANLKIKQNRYFELVENYRQKDLNAIKEINNALNIIQQDKISEKNSIDQLNLEKRTLDISAKKLNRGIISKVDYLNDRNSYYQQQQLTAGAKAVRLVDYLTLYKAVGGDL